MLTASGAFLVVISTEGSELLILVEVEKVDETAAVFYSDRKVLRMVGVGRAVEVASAIDRDPVNAQNSFDLVV